MASGLGVLEKAAYRVIMILGSGIVEKPAGFIARGKDDHCAHNFCRAWSHGGELGPPRSLPLQELEAVGFIYFRSATTKWALWLKYPETTVLYSTVLQYCTVYSILYTVQYCTVQYSTAVYAGLLYCRTAGLTVRTLYPPREPSRSPSLPTIRPSG